MKIKRGKKDNSNSKLTLTCACAETLSDSAANDFCVQPANGFYLILSCKTSFNKYQTRLHFLYTQGTAGTAGTKLHLGVEAAAHYKYKIK